jgi:hypothetical protein
MPSTEASTNFSATVPSTHERQLGGIYKASSGQPFTPLLGGDPSGTELDQTSEPPSRVVSPECETLTNPGDPNHYIKTECLAFPHPSSLRGNLGRNALIGPGLSKFDFSVFKNNHIRRVGENFNAQFRAELFNVFNRANFSSSAREIQFALKLIW